MTSALRRLLGWAPVRLAVLAACGVVLVQSEALWKWDQVIYDSQHRFWSRPPPDDVIIVAIDERSLASLGRWPWSRAVHAQMLERVGAARAVLIDVAFVLPDLADPDADRVLIDAVRDQGRVVLPVLNEEQRRGGPLVELTPFPELAVAAAALGHADQELDRDAIARTSYLRAGLGSPHWSSLALALLEVAGENMPDPLPGTRNPRPEQASPNMWIRDYRIWIPYAGSPGHFPTVSYVDVLQGDIPRSQFRDKVVLVGATAAGLGDVLPTPVSGHNRPMPGVERVANELDTLRRGVAIVPIGRSWLILLTTVLVLIPPLLYPRLPTRWSIATLPVVMLLSLLLSLALLHAAKLWFAPAASLILVLGSYLIWSASRLLGVAALLNAELKRLADEPAVFPSPWPPDIGQALSFVAQFLPITGGTLLGPDGAIHDSWGEAPPPPGGRSQNQGGDTQPPALWKSFDRAGATWRLGLRWSRAQAPTAIEQRTLDSIARQYTLGSDSTARTPTELVRARIVQVQTATDRIRVLRQFVSDTLEQMADGVVVADNVGTILMANPVATAHMAGHRDVTLKGRPVDQAVSALRFDGDDTWRHSLEQIFVYNVPVQLSAVTEAGVDLLVQMVPFNFEGKVVIGVLINLVDVTLLRDRDRRRRELVAFLSHDLRAPLTSILAATDVARLADDPWVNLESIEQNARRTLRLADDFLDLAQAEYAEASDFKPVDLVEVARATVQSVAPQARARGIELRTRFIDEVMVEGDARLLERALANLVSNALKYSDSGARIEVGVEMRPEDAHCWVADTGVGIARGNIERIFDRFYRFGEHAGSGLGLAFVKTVIERHGGRIDVESEPGQGSCFHVVLPVSPVRPGVPVRARVTLEQRSGGADRRTRPRPAV